MAQADEVPDTPENKLLINQDKIAHIAQGYTLRPNTENQFPFMFYAEINVDNDRLWELFETLAHHLPSRACVIYHHIDEEAAYSPYLDLQELLEMLHSYKTEIARDGLLSVGVLYHDDEQLQEVLVTPCKYLKYWGVDEVFFRQTMNDLLLAEIPDLVFIDEVPRVTTPLSRYVPECLDTWEVLGQLLRRFTK